MNAKYAKTKDDAKIICGGAIAIWADWDSIHIQAMDSMPEKLLKLFESRFRVFCGVSVWYGPRSNTICIDFPSNVNLDSPLFHQLVMVAETVAEDFYKESP